MRGQGPEFRTRIKGKRKKKREKEGKRGERKRRKGDNQEGRLQGNQ